MSLSLKVLVGNSAGQLINIPGPKFYIGRSDDCQLRPRSDLISRHHCALIVEGDYLGIRDFGSKNGTQVNDERVVGERELKDGDKLKVGPLQFQVVVTHDPLGGKKKPKVSSVKEAATRTVESSAGPPVNPDDLDIGDWLTSGDESETREMPPGSDTAEISVSDLSKQSDVPTQAAAEGLSDTIADRKKQTPGKLPPQPKAASSDVAAAEMLKRLRRR
ncbi:MAG: FHA domain-containing protein [Planctomycetia bacterium]|nr:FHA domain-containing protein [Planctomycetia bacterium]